MNTSIIDNAAATENSNQFNYQDPTDNETSYDSKQDVIVTKQLDGQQGVSNSACQSRLLPLPTTVTNNKNSAYKFTSYSLGNRIIRHMICSSHKLEEYSNSPALKILFKGKCLDNDMCRRKEVHTHYLIDTTDCRRHISLYFQSSKYGLKFFKTYQIKSQGELEKIIKTFKMKYV